MAHKSWKIVIALTENLRLDKEEIEDMFETDLKTWSGIQVHEVSAFRER